MLFPGEVFGKNLIDILYRRMLVFEGFRKLQFFEWKITIIHQGYPFLRKGYKILD
jgi:hypothetical protein